MHSFQDGLPFGVEAVKYNAEDEDMDDGVDPSEFMEEGTLQIDMDAPDMEIDISEDHIELDQIPVTCEADDSVEIEKDTVDLIGNPAEIEEETEERVENDAVSFDENNENSENIVIDSVDYNNANQEVEEAEQVSSDSVTEAFSDADAEHMNLDTLKKAI